MADIFDQIHADRQAGKTHALGKVTGIDERTSLPIVRRNVPRGTSKPTDSQPAASDSKPSSKAEPVGKTDPESGRQVTQPTDKPAANQKLATEAMPEFKAALENIVNGIPGATLAATRAKKNPERLAEKIGEEGQPPETVSDYGAAQISVDTPAAKDAVIAAVKKAFKVLREDDSWDKGDPEYHYHAYSMQLQMPNGSSEELQILPKEGMEANDTEHSQYKKARDAKNEGEPAEAAQTQARSTNDAAMAKFNARNGQSSENKNYSNGNKSHSPEEHKYKFGNTQVDLPPDSDAHKAIKSMQAKIPKEHLSDVHEDQDKPHVTVRYGVKGSDTSKLKDYISKQAPFEAKLGKTTAFPVSEHSEGAAPIVAHVESPDLHRINGEIEKHGDFEPSNFPDYKPHVTVGYVKPEHAQKYTGMRDGEGKTFKVHSISVGDRDGNKEDVKLRGGGEQKFNKGQPVMVNGKPGKVIYVHDKMRIARVHMDDGKSETVNLKALQPSTEHVAVAAHYRKAPGK